MYWRSMIEVLVVYIYKNLRGSIRQKDMLQTLSRTLGRLVVTCLADMSSISGLKSGFWTTT